jgi:hypothetical protein
MHGWVSLQVLTCQDTSTYRWAWLFRCWEGWIWLDQVCLWWRIRDYPQGYSPSARLGGFITLTHYQDANLYHDIITGCSITGILHFMNKMPIDWYSKKQATVEMTTYGSKFISARTCINQIVDLWLTLRYLGIPIRDVSYMFGDNKTIIDSLTQPHARLHKRHNALSFHCVWEVIASKYVLMMHLSGKANPSNILSKHWGHQAIYPILRPILFFSWNTADLIDDNEMTFIND